MWPDIWWTFPPCRRSAPCVLPPFRPAPKADACSTSFWRGACRCRLLGRCSGGASSHESRAALRWALMKHLAGILAITLAAAPRLAQDEGLGFGSGGGGGFPGGLGGSRQGYLIVKRLQ